MTTTVCMLRKSGSIFSTQNNNVDIKILCHDLDKHQHFKFGVGTYTQFKTTLQ